MPYAEPDQETGQQKAKRNLSRGRKQPEAGYGNDIHPGMKISVGCDLEPDVIGADGAQKMMPLENLVQQDAIEKAAEREPEKITRPSQARAGSGGGHRGSPS